MEKQNNRKNGCITGVVMASTVAVLAASCFLSGTFAPSLLFAMSALTILCAGIVASPECRTMPERRVFSIRRVAKREFGLFVWVSLSLSWFWLLPSGWIVYYARFMDVLPYCCAALCLLSFPYFVLTDGRFDDDDACFVMADVLLSMSGWERLKMHFLVFALKLFFVPFIVSVAIQEMEMLDRWFSGGSWGFPRLVFVLVAFMYLADVLIGFVGYAFSLRLFGTSIERVDGNPLSWGLTLVCYPPFWDSVSPLFNNANSSRWLSALSGYSYLVVLLVGLGIVAMTFVYVWATASFGLRFSNLSDRGIVTTGPYALMAHPAYFAKNVSWWLLALPFLGQSSVGQAIIMSLSLLGINAIYVLRAKMEERFLSKNDEYARYLEWLKENGVFSFLHRCRKNRVGVQSDDL